MLIFLFSKCNRMISHILKDILKKMLFNSLTYEKALTGDLAPFSPFSFLPPITDEKGFYLGVDEIKRPVFLDVSRLPSLHGIILGTTGSGKSTLARHLALEANKHGIKVWIIDPHGEIAYEKVVVKLLKGVLLDLSVEGFDIFNPSGWVPEDYFHTLAEIAVTSYQLPDFLVFDLQKTLLDIYTDSNQPKLLAVPQIRGLVENILSFLGKKRISNLIDKNVYVTFRGRKGRLSLNRQRLGLLSLLARLDGEMMKNANNTKTKLMIIVDEAHDLFKLREGSFLSQLYRESRKFGYSIVSLVQIPGFLPPDIYSLAGFMIFLSGPKEYVEELKLVSYLRKENLEWLLYSVKGNAVLVKQGDPRPRNIILRICKQVIDENNHS
ncbi:MAG: hypothetical protein DRJ35_00710 [Thermoprotei archaeon]|nr:MAG: hypothetical protein DRJ35_00710 [Thermoprotei archaeon]